MAGNWLGRPGNRQMDRTEQAPVIKNNFPQGSRALVFSPQSQDYTPTSMQECRNPLLIIILTYGKKIQVLAKSSRGLSVVTKSTCGQVIRLRAMVGRG